MATTTKARIAVVGCGGWTQGWHLPNLSNREDATIVAVVDPSDHPGVGGCVPSLCQPMADVATKYSAKWYKSIEEVLADNATLQLDGVLVAVPHAYHTPVATKVLNAGLHLLLEKPMTADVAEARALYDLSLAKPKQCFLLNNTANWQPGSIAAHDAVAVRAKLGQIRCVNSVFAAPLGWLFEGEEHSSWAKPTGSMLNNGFGWGQFSHTFAWLYKVTGLTPKTVYCVATTSSATGADLIDSATITCTNGATINATGVGACPDKGFKVVGNWIFGSEGMLSYCGLAGSDNVQLDDKGGDGGTEEPEGKRRRVGGGPCLEIWTNDGEHEVGPPVEFEHLDQGGTGPGSMDAFVAACLGKDYYVGAGALEGLKAVATIDACYRSAQSGKPEAVADACGA